MKIANRDRWKTTPITDAAIQIPLSVEFNETQFNAIQIGLIPKQMEDKWFVFYEDSWLYFHRSWTGFCLFKLKIEKTQDKYLVSEFWAERDERIYTNKNEDTDIHLVQNLLSYMANRVIKDYVRAGILGLIVGDALGVPVEFMSRAHLKENPVKDMMGFGTHHQPVGTWSDDSSLTLCLTESLCGEYDPEKIGQSFLAWYQNGKWTPYGDVFDIGNATREALQNIKNGVKAEFSGGFEEDSNGNGSLMRILPLLFEIRFKDEKERFDKVKQVSSITHAHIRSVLACYYYIEFLRMICEGEGKFYAYEVANARLKNKMKEIELSPKEVTHFERILKGNIHTLVESEIRGSGYVVHSLEASLWCTLNSNSYKEAVLKAVNLGEDTDTTAAITGGMAGMVFGENDIPAEWINKLAKLEEISALLERFKQKYSDTYS